MTYNIAESNQNWGGLASSFPAWFMKKLAFFVAVACLSFPSFASAQSGSAQTASAQADSVQKGPNPQIITVNQIHAGMRGVAYTVFQGVKPEAMEVEVLGVLHNVNGPKGDIILVRLHGQKVEYTGVVAGMSGSPVYLDGKLAELSPSASENSRRSRSPESHPSPKCWKSARLIVRRPKTPLPSSPQ